MGQILPYGGSRRNVYRPSTSWTRSTSSALQHSRIQTRSSGSLVIQLNSHRSLTSLYHSLQDRSTDTAGDHGSGHILRSEGVLPRTDCGPRDGSRRDRREQCGVIFAEMLPFVTEHPRAVDAKLKRSSPRCRMVSHGKATRRDYDLNIFLSNALLQD